MEIWVSVKEISPRLSVYHGGRVLVLRGELQVKEETPSIRDQRKNPDVHIVRKDMRGSVGSYSRNRWLRNGPSVHIMRRDTRGNAELARGRVLVVVRWDTSSDNVCIAQREEKMNKYRPFRT